MVTIKHGKFLEDKREITEKVTTCCGCGCTFKYTPLDYKCIGVESYLERVRMILSVYCPDCGRAAELTFSELRW